MTSEPYDQKFAQFIDLCQKSAADRIEVVLIDHPAVLGDTYDEVIESLSWLADTGLRLHIARR